MADHQRAIVIGSGVAGLLAARVLSERFAQVTVIASESECEPQGLLAGGLTAIESLFPGFAAERVFDVGELGGWSCEGVRLPRMTTGVRAAMSMLRPRLRARLSGNIELRSERVLGLLGSAWKITGVRLEHGGDLEGALVVDASGRDSTVPDMLRRFGLKPPSEERVRIDLRATRAVIERRDGSEGIVCMPCAPNPRGGVVLALDDRRYQVTLFGYLGAQATPTLRGMVEFARGIGDRTLHTLLRDAKLLGVPTLHRHPGSSRRRYERMRHRPRGLLAIGDALCSLNPAYGHGSSLAALQALALKRALESEGRELQQRYFSEATRIIDIPWSMVASADLEFEGARSTQPPPHPSVRAYFKRALHAATRQHAVALAVYRVMQLVDPPSALFAPDLVTHVLGQREPPAPPPRLKLVPDCS